MKKILLLACLLALACLCFASCSCDNEEENLTVTVSFDSHTEVKIPSQSVSVGGKISEPAVALERDGYNFVGWFDGDRKWDFTRDTFDKNITLSAKWESYLSYVAVSEIESPTVKALFKGYEDGVVVTGCDRLGTVSVRVPSIYNGKAVVGIAPYAFADNKRIETVYVPKTIEVIGEGAFFGCTALKKISAEAEKAPTGWSESIVNTQATIEFKK